MKTIDSVYLFQWVDSVLNSLTTQEKIAQLLCVRSYSDKTEKEYQLIDQLVEKYGIGGICFFKGTAQQQIELTNRWQSASKVPIFITIDGESGVGMRLTDVNKFPLAITLGAIENDSVIYEMGREIGKQCRSLGIQINFAPVADINTNPKNPVIGSRSFGENRENVTRKATAYMQGMQDQGIIAVAKHFPGHGDTHSDSHFQLPLIQHDRKRLDSIELFPFQQLVDCNIDGIMVGHLSIPTLDSNKTAASVSQPIVTQLLKEKMHFNGLIITDGLDMQGITNSTQEGETELKAFLAGNDMLLLPRNPIAAINAIADAVENNTISMETLNERCRKILFFKIRNGINAYNFIDTIDALQQLNSATAEEITQHAFEQAATVLVNKEDIIPLKMRNVSNISVINYGQDRCGFDAMLHNFAPFRTFSYTANLKTEKFNNDSVIIAVVYSSTQKVGKYGIAEAYIQHIQQLAKEKKVILCLFASPYALSLFKNIPLHGLIVGYENKKFAGDAVAQILCGILPASGHLPVTAGNFKVGSGISIKATQRLTFSSPNELNINEKYLKIIDSIAQSGIDSCAYPGCQIIIAKDGKVFYDKSFGYFTYEKKHKVTNSDLYDVASLTKIMATTPCMMLLNDQQKIDIDQTLGYYLPFLDSTNKQKLIIREVLAHQAQLKSWIPFYKIIETPLHPNSYIYSSIRDEQHTIAITSQMYMRPEYQDSVFAIIANSDLLPKKRYVYSDLGMILMGKIIEKTTQQPLQNFVSDNFYSTMNLATIGYHPLERFQQHDIAPTENDSLWRKQQIQGSVHDMGSALLNGVAGHAGIFSNAWDIACMMQMYLQQGQWNMKSYIQPATLKEFTEAQFPLEDNRRGLGFDRPLSYYSSKGPVCKSASQKSFGHSGFTGCYAWADPANGLVYVFLSNRIFPDSNNTKLSNMDIRTKIHQAAYDALLIK
ncbi:MAG: glycoside hydrolase family 3 N-terminal domain-containing protein [Bacteroidales bacterium]|nr:glycoside hydrolase family 3 N-terminal domain-containing protein [Bacteroidales bacterium]